MTIRDKDGVLVLGDSSVNENNITIKTPGVANGSLEFYKGTPDALGDKIFSVDSTGTDLAKDLSSTDPGKGAALVGFKQNGTGAVPRTLEDKAREWVSVKDFGAVGDGVTDDTVAVQNWLNSGKNLYAVAGNYIVDGNLIIQPGTSIQCDGCNTIFKVADNKNPSFVFSVGTEASVSKFEIHGGVIDGNKSKNPTGGDGLRIIRGYRANLYGTRVINCHGHGIVYSATASSFENYCYNISSYNNDGYGVYMIGGGITDTHISGGDIGYNGLGSIHLASSCSVSNSTLWGGGQPNSVGVVIAGVGSQVINNKIEGHGKHGIDTGSGDAFYICGNKIYANAFTAETSGNYDGIYVSVDANFGTIVGNKVYSALSSTSPYSMRYAVNFAGSHSQCVIQGNDFALLVGGNPPSFNITSAVVNGVLSSDKCDFNWIRTNIQSRIAASFSPGAAFTWTIFPFDVEDIDVLSEFSNGVFIPKNSGLYRIQVAATYKASGPNEDIGIALYRNSGTVLRRIDFKKSVADSSQMIHGVIEEFLTSGVAYDIRYLTGSTTSVFQHGAEFTYCKIRAIAN